jgi:hypothetical protein
MHSVVVVGRYTADEQFVLKGSEVWLNGRCCGRVGNINSKATLAHEDIIYQHLGPSDRLVIDSNTEHILLHDK